MPRAKINSKTTTTATIERKRNELFLQHTNYLCSCDTYTVHYIRLTQRSKQFAYKRYKIISMQKSIVVRKLSSIAKTEIERRLVQTCSGRIIWWLIISHVLTMHVMEFDRLAMMRMPIIRIQIRLNGVVVVGVRIIWIFIYYLDYVANTVQQVCLDPNKILNIICIYRFTHFVFIERHTFAVNKLLK